MARKQIAEEIDIEAGEKRRKPSAVTGLQIVEFLARNPRGVRFGEIAEAIQMDRGQTHRILIAMMEDGWIIAEGDSGYYSLAGRVIAIAATYTESLDLADHAQPYMDELFQKTGESVFLGELRNENVICVGRRLADRTLTVWTEVGNSWPLDGTAVGLSIQAGRAARQTPSERGEILPDELASALRDGYARDFGRYRTGVESVAAPIRNSAGLEIGTISVAGPVARMGQPEIEKFGNLVREAARAISSRMGWVRGDELLV